MAFEGVGGVAVVVRIVFFFRRHVVPFGEGGADLRAHVFHEDVSVSEEDVVPLEPILFEPPETFDLCWRDVVICHDGETPCITVDFGGGWIESGWGIALEMRKCLVQRDLYVFEYFSQCTVAYPVGCSKVLVVSDAHGSLGSDFAHSRVG